MSAAGEVEGSQVTRRAQERDPRGYFAVGVLNPKKSVNIGTLWRTAYILGAAYVFTVGARYSLQSSDTVKSHRHIPLVHYPHFDDFYEHMPYDAQLVGVELAEGAKDLGRFTHPPRAVYLLGAEDHGLPQAILDRCHHLVRLRGEFSMNVSVAGSIVLYHRGENDRTNIALHDSTEAPDLEVDATIHAPALQIVRAV